MYYLKNNGSDIGPLSDEAVRGCINTGTISQDSWIWYNNCWTPIKETHFGNKKTNYSFIKTVGRAAIGAVTGIAIWFGYNNFLAGFSDQDIDNTSNAVRQEFQKRPGIYVSDVSFIKQSRTRLIGLVKLRVKNDFTGDYLEVSKECSADYGSGGHYIWRCE